MTDKSIDVKKMINLVGELSNRSKYLYDQYKLVEAQKTAAKHDLMTTLQAIDLHSAKTDNFTASIASKQVIYIKHEQSILDWLQETPDIETDQYIGLKKAEFKNLAMAMLKNTGEIIPGTEIMSQESISVRSNKR